MGLVNASVPRAGLRAEVETLAARAARQEPRRAARRQARLQALPQMSWDQAEDYLYAKLEQSQFLDSERGREQGLTQFLDEKSIRPGLQTYERPQN